MYDLHIQVTQLWKRITKFVSSGPITKSAYSENKFYRLPKSVKKRVVSAQGVQIVVFIKKLALETAARKSHSNFSSREAQKKTNVPHKNQTTLASRSGEGNSGLYMIMFLKTLLVMSNTSRIWCLED